MTPAQREAVEAAQRPNVTALERERAERRFVEADKEYQRAQTKSIKAALVRGAMPAGSTRARVTTANARWATAAEARDRIQDRLRVEFQKLVAMGAAAPLARKPRPRKTFSSHLQGVLDKMNARRT